MCGRTHTPTSSTGGLPWKITMVSSRGAPPPPPPPCCRMVGRCASSGECRGAGGRGECPRSPALASGELRPPPPHLAYNKLILASVCQAVTAAEATYSRAMTAVSRVKLVSEYDGPTLRTALTRFSDVPWLLGEVGLLTAVSCAASSRCIVTMG